MSYTPTNWKTGDIVTAEKLNKAENAIGFLRAELTSTGMSCSYSDILNALNNGRIPVIINEDSVTGEKTIWYISWMQDNPGETSYVVHFSQGGLNVLAFSSTDPDSPMSRDT